MPEFLNKEIPKNLSSSRNILTHTYVHLQSHTILLITSINLNSLTIGVHTILANKAANACSVDYINHRVARFMERSNNYFRWKMLHNEH